MASRTLTSSQNRLTLTEPTLFIKTRERGQGEWCSTTRDHGRQILKLYDALLASGKGTLKC